MQTRSDDNVWAGVFNTRRSVVQKVLTHVCVLWLIPCTQHVQHSCAHCCTPVSGCAPHRNSVTVQLCAGCAVHGRCCACAMRTTSSCACLCLLRATRAQPAKSCASRCNCAWQATILVVDKHLTLMSALGPRARAAFPETRADIATGKCAPVRCKFQSTLALVAWCRCCWCTMHECRQLCC